LTCLIPVGCGFAGLLAGVLLQQHAQLRATVDVWPETWEVVDWGRVRQLLDEDDRARGRLPDEDDPGDDRHDADGR
jgi:hypothetical protein